MAQRVNPESLAEVYDALDTVRHDLYELDVEHAELETALLGEAHSLVEEATARMLLEHDRRKRTKAIEQRRNYATSSIKGMYLTKDDELIAEAEYLAQYDDDQKALNEASSRVLGYRAMARKLMIAISLPSDSPGQEIKSAKTVTSNPRDFEAQMAESIGPIYRINPEVKRTDSLGRVWINLCHPRGVLSDLSPEQSPEEVTTNAGVVANLGQGSINEDEAGVMSVEFKDGRASLRFDRSSTLYRTNERGEVLVIRPTNVVGSVMDTLCYQDQGQLNGVRSRRNEASEVALAAAGQPGSIWDTFNDQQGNPRPISVAKRN